MRIGVFQQFEGNPEYTGIGGYMKNGNRTAKSDFLLVQAALILNLSMDDLFLWVNSRYARHDMDGYPNDGDDQLGYLIKCLQNDLPDLREEVNN